MDWCSWLSNANLEPSLVYEYSLAFAQNELEEEDIAYFNHEFLQSMGIAIAKHRLEILKLARKNKKSSYPVSRLFFAIKNTKRSLSRYLRTLIHRDHHDRALVVVSGPMTRSYSSRWRRTTMGRNRKLVVVRAQRQKQEEDRVMMLTDGVDGRGSEYPLVVSAPRLNSFSSPLGVEAQSKKKLDDGYAEADADEGEDVGNWTLAVEEIKWDAMFQDLNPT